MGQNAHAAGDEAVTVADLSDAGSPTSPAVLSPFRPRLSPHVTELERSAVEWATRQGLIAGPAIRRYARARFARLIARTYPDAPPTALSLATAWLTTVFALDDHLETALGRDPARQREIRALLLDHLGGAVTVEPLAAAVGAPLSRALAVVWARTAAAAGPAWRERFRTHLADYLAGNVWEAENRATGRVPGVPEYLRMRRSTAATAIFFDLIEVFGGVELTPAAAADPAVLALRRHADNVVAWFNDLVSWPKELARGDVHNLVLVLARNTGVALPEAVRTVVAWHDAEVTEFLRARHRLPAALRATAGVEPMVAGLTYWIRGNVDWSRESGRYAVAQR
ncbi:MAG TPA: hypothetical protein VK453_22835 [Micromonosporaceae bacterium]|nr:hypothetical protein [Micromonosporaceae bacterium]